MRAMQISSEHPLLLRIVDDLAEHGWSQQNIFLPLDLTRALAAECRKRAAEGELAPAAVGRISTVMMWRGLQKGLSRRAHGWPLRRWQLQSRP